jgi:hypothetical protein
MELMKLLKSLNCLHGLVQPLPGGLDGVDQQVLGECVHETLHLKSPQKELPRSDLLLLGPQIFETLLVKFFPAIFEKLQYLLQF